MTTAEKESQEKFNLKVKEAQETFDQLFDLNRSELKLKEIHDIKIFNELSKKLNKLHRELFKGLRDAIEVKRKSQKL